MNKKNIFKKSFKYNKKLIYCDGCNEDKDLDYVGDKIYEDLKYNFNFCKYCAYRSIDDRDYKEGKND